MVNKLKAVFKPAAIVLGIVAIVLGIIVSILDIFITESEEKITYPQDRKQLQTIEYEADILGEPEYPVSDSREALAPEAYCIKGYVRDKETEENITIFDLQINRKGKKGTDKKGNFEWDSVIHETVNRSTGYFNFPLNDAGVYSVTVRSSCYKKHVTEEINLSEKDKTKELVIYLDSGYSIRGVVVDDATEDPVEGARVFPLTTKMPDTQSWLLRGFDEYSISATTNERGVFILSGLDRRTYFLAGIHPRYAESTVEASPVSGDDIELRMKTGPVIFGKAYDDNGKPVSNLLITVLGNQLPMPRSVLTGIDGGFRTAPVRPGRIFVRASLFSDGRAGKAASVFTTETQMVRMRDRDEEVIFGPSPGKVTWRGHLYKRSDEPVSGGMVEIFPILTRGKGGKGVRGGKDAYIYRAGSKATCNEEGLFEFRKLVTGTYRVRVFFPEGSSHFNWGEVNLDKPGLIEKDIRLPGGEIHGMVVDQITGQPVTGIEGEINATTMDQKYKNYTALLDRKGCFHFHGLPAGEYQLTSALEESLQRSTPCTVRENEVVENFRLAVIHGGRLLLKLREFITAENNDFNMSVRRLDGGGIDDLKKSGKGKGEGKGVWDKGWSEGEAGYADWETQRVLEPGMYEVELDFLSFGTVKRSFEIFPGQATNVEIFRYELGTAATDIFDITAILEYHDGIPLDGAYVLLDAKGDRWNSNGRTDSEGRVTLKGMRPGTWKMDVWVVGSASKSSITCPDLVFLEGKKPPNPLVIVISIGIIRGTLLDSSTNRALGERVDGWRIVLRDAETQKPITESYGGEGKSEFNLIGINEGEYRLGISARGFKDFNSEPLTLRKNQILDLGRIKLEPEDGG